MSVEILKQLADLKGLMNSYRRALDKQQQEITTLKRSQQAPNKEIGTYHLNHIRPGQRGGERAVLSRSSLRLRVLQPDRPWSCPGGRRT